MCLEKQVWLQKAERFRKLSTEQSLDTHTQTDRTADGHSDSGTPPPPPRFKYSPAKRICGSITVAVIMVTVSFYWIWKAGLVCVASLEGNEALIAVACGASPFFLAAFWLHATRGEMVTSSVTTPTKNVTRWENEFAVCFICK